MKEIISQDLLLRWDIPIIPWISGLVMSEVRFFFSCFEISEVRALKINCLWGQLWKIWTQSMLSHVVAQQKAIGRPLIPFGSIIRKVLGWGKWTLNFAMHFKALLNIRMENLVLASPMAYVMDKIFYFFVSSKHKSCFVGGCCVLRFPVSPWRAGWRGRIRHFPFASKNFVFTSWVLSEVTSAIFYWHICSLYQTSEQNPP